TFGQPCGQNGVPEGIGKQGRSPGSGSPLSLRGGGLGGRGLDLTHRRPLPSGPPLRSGQGGEKHYGRSGPLAGSMRSRFNSFGIFARRFLAFRAGASPTARFNLAPPVFRKKNCSS